MSESNNFVCEEKQGRKENIPYRVTLLVLVVLLSKYAQNPQFLHCLCIGPATNRSRESNISSRLFLCLSIGLSICSYFIIQGNPTKGKLDNIFLPQKPPIVYCNIQGERSSFQSPFLFDLWLLFVSLCIYSSCVPAQVACGWSLTGIICKIFVLTVTMFRNHLTCVCCANHQIPHLLWCVHCVLQQRVGQAEDWAHLVTFYHLFLPYRQAPCGTLMVNFPGDVLILPPSHASCLSWNCLACYMTSVHRTWWSTWWCMPTLLWKGNTLMSTLIQGAFLKEGCHKFTCAHSQREGAGHCWQEKAA